MFQYSSRTELRCIENVAKLSNDFLRAIIAGARNCEYQNFIATTGMLRNGYETSIQKHDTVLSKYCHTSYAAYNQNRLSIGVGVDGKRGVKCSSIGVESGNGSRA